MFKKEKLLNEIKIRDDTIEQLNSMIKIRDDTIDQLKNKVLNYTDWEKDLGFLTLILTREINMNKIFVIDPMIRQLQDENATIRDEDIMESFDSLVETIFVTLSEEYKNFLCMKYFKDENTLLQFISDNVYVELLNNANQANKQKFIKMVSKRHAKGILNLNNRKPEK